MFFTPLPRPVQTLSVKVGEHEFEAEGPPTIVLLQYNAWLIAIGHVPTEISDVELGV